MVFVGVPICHPLGLPVLAGALIGCGDANDSEHPENGARKRLPFIFVPRGIACDSLQSFVFLWWLFGSQSWPNTHPETTGLCVAMLDNVRTFNIFRSHLECQQHAGGQDSKTCDLRRFSIVLLWRAHSSLKPVTGRWYSQSATKTSNISHHSISSISYQVQDILPSLMGAFPYIDFWRWFLANHCDIKAFRTTGWRDCLPQLFVKPEGNGRHMDPGSFIILPKSRPRDVKKSLGTKQDACLPQQRVKVGVVMK